MYLGDIPSQQTIDFFFTTVNSSGVPTTLGGTPAISVYKTNDVAQTTTGVTLTVDFDGVTGLNHVRIVTTNAFYATGADYHVVITTGTVGGNSVVGYRVAEFSIENRVTKVDVAKISGDSTAADNLESAYDGTGYADGTAQAGAAGSITLASSAHSTNDGFYKGALVAIISGTGAGQAARLITGYTASTRVATVYPNWVVNPDNTSTYVLIPWGALGRIFSEAMDDMLKRDLTGITGEAQRSWLNSIRFGVNKIDIAGNTLTIYKENDSTPAFTMTITFNASQLPIATLDP